MHERNPITLPSKYGPLHLEYFTGESGDGCVVVSSPPLGDGAYLRVQSSCLFSESFGTVDCDCASQLDIALATIAAHGGLLIYLFQEGRGIGLKDKFKAIHLQHTQGIGTVEAFETLGIAPDPRQYDIVVAVLRELHITKVRLATNNQLKAEYLRSAGVEVVRIPLRVPSNPNVAPYLEMKRKSLGHDV